MDCYYCKGKMERGTASYTVNRRGYHLVLDRVPAYVCKQCGEPHFDEQGVQLVQEMVREVDRGADALQAAV